MQDNLEKIINSKIIILSEIGYDSIIFNSEAYQNLLKHLKDDKDIRGILIDGAISRLDRPEYLNDELSYWDKSEEECNKETESIPNREQYTQMAETQYEIVSKRLKELRNIKPDSKIVFSLHSDDLQYTSSAMLNEFLLRKHKDITDKIKSLKQTRRHQKQSRKKFLKNDEENKVDRCDKKISGIEEDLQNLEDERKLYREKKVRPMHQLVTKEFVEGFISKYQELCEDLEIQLITGEQTLDFDNLRINYSHSRHSTWHPVKTRDKRLSESVQGNSEELKNVDVLLESGHFGIGFKQYQKLRDSQEETNFENNDKYDGISTLDDIVIVMALPFEDQSKVSEFVKGKQFIRLAGGKPMSSRKSVIVDRYNNGGVSGVTVIGKDEEGLINTEWIEYGCFLEEKEKPEKYKIIGLSSDEHLRSAESNPLVIDGWVKWLKNLREVGRSFRGKPAKLESYINAGDVGEANSRKWNHRYQHKQDPRQVLKEIIINKGEFDIKNLFKLMQFNLQGSTESMQDVLESVADYLEEITDLVYDSDSNNPIICVPGNHGDNVLRDLGLRETDFYRQRMKGLGRKVYQVGLDIPKDARIKLGGYSNARCIQIDDYDGIKLIVQHDPKGSGMRGVVGEGKNVNADLSIAGHTHDNCMKLTRVEDNKFRVAYKSATLQGVSPTEKYYASGLPRTQASHELIINSAGDFSERTIPAEKLKLEGLKSLEGLIVKD